MKSFFKIISRLLLFLGAIVPLSTCYAQSQSPRFAVALDDREILGPFSSWINVKNLGAVGDGNTDDTAAIQNAINTADTTGGTVYFPAGTYEISSSLNITVAPDKLNGVHLIGADPNTVKIQWKGRPNLAMLIENNGTGDSFERITWDGQGIAAIGVAHWFNTTEPNPTGTNPMHEDEVFENLAIGIMAGREGSNYSQMNSEGYIERVTFLNDSFAGFDTGSPNALDWWIFDSQFIDCARGVTNNFTFTDNTTVQYIAPTLNANTTLSFAPNMSTGYGAMYVYRSYFENSTVADFDIGNTMWFSLHKNVSRGSKRFFNAAGMGGNSAPTIIESNLVQMPSGDTNPAITIGNEGPAILIDNQIQSPQGSSGPVVKMTDWVPGRDVLSVDNTYTVANANQVVSSSDHLVSINDTITDYNAINITPPSLPPTPAFANRQIFEVPAGATSAIVQSTIDAAVTAANNGAVNPVVLFPNGTTTLDQTVTVPALTHIEFEGNNSVLNWSGQPSGPMFNFIGPSYVKAQDFRIGTSVSPTVVNFNITNADQAGGRIFIEHSNIGLNASDLMQTQLNTEACQTTPVTVSNVQNYVAMANGIFGPVTSSWNSSTLIMDSWYEGVDSNLYQINSGTLSYMGGMLAPYTHKAKATTTATPAPTTSSTMPAVSLDNFQGDFTVIGALMNLTQIPSGLGFDIGAETNQTNALFLGIAPQVAPQYNGTTSYFNRLFQEGQVGLFMSKAGRAANSSAVDAPDQGTTSNSFILNMLTQVRSLQWDTTPYQAPAGSTDVGLYNVFAPNIAIAGSTPVNGSCGLANGTTVNSAPTANLCSMGTASSVSGSGPFTWECAGISGGTTASCQASFSVITTHEHHTRS